MEWRIKSGEESGVERRGEGALKRRRVAREERSVDIVGKWSVSEMKRCRVVYREESRVV